MTYVEKIVRFSAAPARDRAMVRGLFVAELFVGRDWVWVSASGGLGRTAAGKRCEMLWWVRSVGAFFANEWLLGWCCVKVRDFLGIRVAECKLGLV